ncbi:glycosyltransferase [Rickettsia endosymbiont of Aspidapion aeneum]|uniref:glycosyltransferase n=1 Tax=Rickettsia endosymbiont of Aspidapion aeneum TaxID=3066247 RepID=UPI00313D7153
MTIDILFLLDCLQKGGAERVASNIMNSLSSNPRYNINLITFYSETETYQYELNENVKVTKSSIQNEKDHLLELIDNTKIELVISFLYMDRHINLIYKHYPDIKYIFTVHSTLFYFAPFVDKLLNIIAKANITTVLNTYTYKSCRLAGLNNITIIPNLNTFNTYDIEPQFPNNKNLLCIGDFTRDMGRNKRLDRVLKVFIEVKRKHNDAVLYVIGLYNLTLKINNETETLEELIEKNNLEIGKDIIFTGVIYNVSSYYKKSAVYIMTSTLEGMPMVLLESGAYGLPVVANKINGLEDVILEGQNGFIVEQDDIKGMAEKTILLLQDSELRLKISKKAIELAKRFDNDKVISQWETIINMVLSNDQLTINKLLYKNINYTTEDYKNIALDSLTACRLATRDNEMLIDIPSYNPALCIVIHNPIIKKTLLGVKYILKKLHLLGLLKRILQ